MLQFHTQIIKACARLILFHLYFIMYFYCILQYISVPENAVFTSGRSSCMSSGSCERGKNQFIWTFPNPFEPKLIFYSKAKIASYSKACRPMSTCTYIAIFLFLTMQFSPPAHCMSRGSCERGNKSVGQFFNRGTKSTY